MYIWLLTKINRSHRLEIGENCSRHARSRLRNVECIFLRWKLVYFHLCSTSGVIFADFLSPREGFFNGLITFLPGCDSIYGGASNCTKLHGIVGYPIRKYFSLYTKSSSAVHSLITKRGKALHIIFRYLNSAMDLKQNGWHEREDLKSVSHTLYSLTVATRDSRLIQSQMTLLQNMIQASKDSDYWAPNTLIQAIVGIWFAASHQPWIVSKQMQSTTLSPHKDCNYHADVGLEPPFCCLGIVLATWVRRANTARDWRARQPRLRNY